MCIERWPTSSAATTTAGNGGAELDEETKAAVAKAYRTKMEALELLHYQLGHLPYERIERLIRLGVIPGYVVDKKLLRKVHTEKDV